MSPTRNLSPEFRVSEAERTRDTAAYRFAELGASNRQIHDILKAVSVDVVMRAAIAKRTRQIRERRR